MIRSAFVLLSLTISLSATTINVPADQATIQGGIDAAVDGDTVLVEAGLYYETIDFIGKNIVLLSSSGPSSTIIDGTTGGDTTSVVNMSSWGYSADCIIDGFTIQNGLVGISASPDYSNPTLTIHNCIITNTGTAISGHFLQRWEISKTLVVNNDLGFSKGYYGDSSVIINCTFDNSIRDIAFNPSYGTTSELSIYNSIFRNQIDGYETNPVNMYYCDYADGSLGANVNIIAGNITNDPLFVDPANNNYSLQPTSPCIDSGDPISLSNDSDGSRNDIGYTGGNNIIVEKSAINFGFVSDDVTSVATVRLNNYSDETISLSGYSNNDDQFSIFTTFPVTLSSGESTEIGFSYTAVSSGLSSDIITVNITGIPGVSAADFNVSGHAIIYDGGTIAVPGAAPTIQSAIDFASNGDTVLVQPGIYAENINFNGKNIVVGSLYLTTQDTSYISQTIIDGGGASKVVTFASNETRLAHLSGFTILNGTSQVDYFGGGILIANASPTVSNCIVRDNLISWYGGGICIKDNSSPLLDGLIVNNNVATHHGGGIAVLDGATPTIQNSLLFGNSTGELGGAIYIAWNPTKVTLINCTLTNNSATGGGGVFGGGISVSGHGELETSNSIVWGNVPNQIDDEYNTDQTVNYSCIQNGYTGIGNVTTDPLFVDPINSDYNLQAGSPCIDAGDPSSPRDQDGSRVDMGAFPSNFGIPLAVTLTVPDEYSTIQDAINASRSGDTVLVSPGTYVENLSIDGKDITLGSLFLASQDTSYISQTIIDGNQSGSVLTITNTATGSVDITGLTIRNGSGLYDAIYDPWVGGGGIFTKDANLNIVNCRITNCSESYRYGGGILFYPSSKSLIVSNTLIDNCSSADAGGGLALFASGNFTLTNTQVQDCYAGFAGGGLYSGGELHASDLRFRNNHGGSLGGAFNSDGGDSYFEKCLFTQNLSGNGGGAISFGHTSNVILNQCTIVDNDGTTRGGAIIKSQSGTLSIMNSIVQNNSDQYLSQIWLEAGVPLEVINIEYSNIQQDTVAVYHDGDLIFNLSSTNTDVPSRFVNDTSSDYRLLASSYLINSGHPDSTDSDGTRADMGAYPYFNSFSGPEWYVAEDGDDISGTGEELNPFRSIQAGINFSNDHDSVFVDAGTYVENVDFRGHSVSLKGTSGAGNTIVDGNASGSVLSATSQEDITTSIEGFTIQNGTGTFVYINEGNLGTIGGGVFLSNANLNISLCIVSNNHVTYSGGGIGGYQGLSLEINNSEILNNTAVQDGGGVLLHSGSSAMSNTKLAGNSARNGGGLTVSGTVADLRNIEIYGNTASSQGGGLFSSSNYILSNSLIYNNLAEYGGGIKNHYHLNPTLINNTIVNNEATEFGGGISYSGLIDGPQTIINSIIYYNNSPLGAQFHSDGSEMILLNSIVQDWDSTDSNIDLDPRFISLEDNDFHLSDYSPALGAGLDTTIVPTFDIDGNIRPNPAGSNPDIGAYESPLAEPIVIVEIQNLDIGGGEDLDHLISHNPQISYTYYNSLEEPLIYYQIQVSSMPNFAAIDKWDTYTVIGSDTIVAYGGNSLVDGVDYYLRVKGSSGEIWSDWATLAFKMNSIPPSPILLSPIENAVIGDETVFNLQNSSDLELDELMYQFYLYEDVAMSTLVESSELISEGIETTSWISTSELADNNQYWWTAHAYDGYEFSSLTSPASFLVNTDNAPPEPFELIYPLNDIELSSLTPTFSWHTAVDVDPDDVVSYELYLDTPEPGVEVYELGSDTLFQPPAPLLDNTSYFWRVVAKDVLGFETNSVGSYRKFTVNLFNDNPSVVDLITPDSVMVLTLTPQMVWSPATDIDPGDVVSYEMHWWAEGLDLDSVLTDTNAVILPRELADNTQYFWEVIAMDQTDGISHSEPATFWTDLVPEAPEGFALLSPENDAAGLSNMPSFQWEIAEDPDPMDYATYTLQIATDSSFSEVVFETNTSVETSLELTESLPTDTEYWWRVVATDSDSLITESEIFKFTVGYVSIAEEVALPTEYMLDQNYPNPFNPSTTIRYGLPEEANISLVIYDVRGQVVQAVASGQQSAGWYDVVWNGQTTDGKTISTGIYFARLVAGDYSQVIKMLYLK